MLFVHRRQVQHNCISYKWCHACCRIGCNVSSIQQSDRWPIWPAMKSHVTFWSRIDQQWVLLYMARARGQMWTISQIYICLRWITSGKNVVLALSQESKNDVFDSTCVMTQHRDYRLVQLMGASRFVSARYLTWQLLWRRRIACGDRGAFESLLRSLFAIVVL